MIIAKGEKPHTNTQANRKGRVKMVYHRIEHAT